MGVGIHGEPRRRRTSLRHADDIAREMVDAAVDDLALPSESSVLLFVNGFGATPVSELYLMYEAARSALASRNVRVTRSLVGSLVTSPDLAGCSITITQLERAFTLLWDTPVHTPALRWG
jgi:dihydroxyacetone kinase-like protein